MTVYRGVFIARCGEMLSRQAATILATRAPNLASIAERVWAPLILYGIMEQSRYGRVFVATRHSSTVAHTAMRWAT